MEKEIIHSLNKVWLVCWGFDATDEDKELKRYGIRCKIVDILSTRKTFEHILETAKSIYQQTLLCPSEKAGLAHYNKGEKSRQQFFDRTIPCFTHYHSDRYRELMQNIQEDLHGNRTQELLDQWKLYPEYVVLGHNPYLEIIKVFNLVVYLDKEGVEIIEWDRPLPDGKRRHEQYKWPGLN